MNPPKLSFGPSSFSLATATATPASTTAAPAAGTSLTTPATTTTTTTNALPTLGTSLLSNTQPAATSTASPLTNPAASTTSTTGTSGTAANDAQANLTFKVLEDYINKWMSDLQEQEKEFLNQATQLNALDKVMIENGEKVVDLNNEIDRLTNEQTRLDHDFDFIFSQQNDLEASIKKLETSIDSMPQIMNSSQQQFSNQSLQRGNSDTSRIELYKLLVELDNQLRGMSGDLKDIIERINATNVNQNDPATQISKILNSQMYQLDWVEKNTDQVKEQINKLGKVLDDRSREGDSIGQRML